MASLNTLLIGHRGTGKSSLLKQFHSRHPGIAVFDLDDEIAHSLGESVDQIFARSEAEFRNHERRVLMDLLKRPGQKVIAVGAGFEGAFPAGTHVIWVRRLSDTRGRSFVNRPRLNARVSPYTEYQERFATRERRYWHSAHEILTLPEGADYADLADFLGDHKWNIGADLTLLTENFRDWPRFLESRLQWGIRRFEVRDDLLQPDEITRALRDIPPDKLIYSCRASREMPNDLQCDYPFEWGMSGKAPFILSLHERDRELANLIRDFSAAPATMHKLAVEIRDFAELEQGHKWWREAPDRRAFLPRSPDGRWRWYRSLFGPQMPLHYIRECEGSGLDQPLLWQSLLQPALKKNFAAVLGFPVDHSLSPIEHRRFFADTPFVSIAIAKDEFPFAMRVLREWGLKWAAVTAPLKKEAAAICEKLSPEADSLKSVNTLYFDGQKWNGHNTDVLALARLREGLPAFKKIWLWGGGGVKSSVKRVWPDAREISARAGVPSTEIESPDLLIWATGRNNEFRFPPSSARPNLVLDLNYGDDSPGLEWAVQNKLLYQSGLEMFKLQAHAQRHYWREQKDS